VDTPEQEPNPAAPTGDEPAPEGVAPNTAPIAAWYPDPARRHQFRYWDGTAWTGDVATNGVTSWDPPYTDHPGAAAAPAPRTTTSTAAPAPVAPGAVALRRTSGPASALGWILGIAAGALVARLAAAVYRIIQVRTAQSWDESKDPAPLIRRLHDSDNYLDATAAISAVFLVTILVLLIIWMYRSARNARAIDRWDNGLTPGWAIGGWFVPVANWFAPATIMQSLWRGAEPVAPVPGAAKRRSAAVGLWWVCYLAGMFCFAQGLGVDTKNADSAQQLYNADTWTIVGCVLLGTAALVLRGSVLAIQRRIRAITADAV
jgi:hypothetical protein